MMSHQAEYEFAACAARHISDKGGGALTGGLVLMNDSL